LSREGALREHAVVGETPNLAARLQALAEPGTIVVAASTRRLLGDLFRLRDLGRHEVRGIAEPAAAWAVEGVSDSESRFEALRAAGPPGAGRVPLPTGVRAAVGWSPQCQHLDARSPPPLQRPKHGRAGDGRAYAARRSDRTHRGQDRRQPAVRRGTDQDSARS